MDSGWHRTDAVVVPLGVPRAHPVATARQLRHPVREHLVGGTTSSHASDAGSSAPGSLRWGRAGPRVPPGTRPVRHDGHRGAAWSATPLARLVAATRAAGAAAAREGRPPLAAPPTITGAPPDLTGIPIPVLARDWVVHPLQLAEAKAAGAGGLLGGAPAVLGRVSCAPGPV